MDETLTMIRGLLDAVQLVPAPYERYQPLVVDALVFFLERLPEGRLERIVSAQLELDADATPDDRLIALLRECPTLHKLGQVVAHERGLPLALRERLQCLESLPPTSDLAEVRATIDREIPAIPALDIEEHALAEGSVAIVIPFAWSDESGERRRGVFKVLKPQAVARLREELAIWPALSEFLDAHSVQDRLPTLDYRETLDGVANLLRSEIDLVREQEHLRWAATFYANTADVVIPQLLPFSTQNVTAMERIDGRKVTDADVKLRVRERLAKTMMTALIAMPFWRASDPPARFHADPHAGNLLVTPDGRLAIIDWALVTELSEAQLSGVVRALLAALTLDETETMAAIAALGRVCDEPALRAEVALSLARVRKGALPGFLWLTDVLDRLGRAGAMQFPEETTLFRKSMLTLSGVVADVCERVQADGLLIRSGLRAFLGELRGRLSAPLDSRRIGTHLSNADLIRLWAAVPWIPTRFWLDTWRDALRGRAVIPPHS
jgi:ubiquinone biosynthesis protein